MILKQSSIQTQNPPSSLFHEFTPIQGISYEEALKKITQTAAKYHSKVMYNEIQENYQQKEVFPSLSEAVHAINAFLDQLNQSNQSLYHQITENSYGIYSSD